MNSNAANLNPEEIFAECLAPFCRVAGLAAGNFLAVVKIMPVFQGFCGVVGIISLWHDRC
jgi:hypothetical protein